jgi:hypothetical protein
LLFADQWSYFTIAVSSSLLFCEFPLVTDAIVLFDYLFNVFHLFIGWGLNIGLHLHFGSHIVTFIDFAFDLHSFGFECHNFTTRTLAALVSIAQTVDIAMLQICRLASFANCSEAQNYYYY